MRLTKQFKKVTLAMLALTGMGLATHSSHAHASQSKPLISYDQSQHQTQGNPKQMNYLAQPKGNQVYSRQTTPRVVTGSGMAKTQPMSSQGRINNLNNAKSANLTPVHMSPLKQMQAKQKQESNYLPLVSVLNGNPKYRNMAQPKQPKQNTQKQTQQQKFLPLRLVLSNMKKNQQPAHIPSKPSNITPTIHNNTNHNNQHNSTPNYPNPDRHALVHHGSKNKANTQRKLQYYFKSNNKTYGGTATWEQLNHDKSLPKNTIVVDNDPKVVQNNLSEAYNTTLQNLNQDRAQNGLKKLTTTPELNELATERAQQLEIKWGHYDSNGVSIEDKDAVQMGMFKSINDSSYHMAENISTTMLSPDALMPSDPNTYKVEDGHQVASSSNDAMYNFDGHETDWTHRTNILNPYETEVGIGTAYSPKNSMYYIVEDFYQPQLLTSDKQYDDYVNKAMSTLPDNDFTESDKLACQEAGQLAHDTVIQDGGSKAQANQAYQSTYANMLKKEIKK